MFSKSEETVCVCVCDMEYLFAASFRFRHESDSISEEIDGFGTVVVKETGQFHFRNKLNERKRDK
jgi:hypothetical protein